MEPTITATTNQPAEPNDDRYVAICTRIKLKGEALREFVFKAIEADDYETAFEHLDTIQKIDRAYMLSLQKGMGIVENKRKAEEAKKAAAAQVATNNAISATSPEPSKSFIGKIFRR